MPAYVGVSSAHKDIEKMYVGVSDEWKTVANAYVGVSGAWEEVFTNFAVSISTTDISKFSETEGTYYTAAVTVTAEGTGPFTYSWVRQAGGDSQITATSPGLASSTFGAYISGPGVELVDTFICQVTDTSSGAVLFAPLLTVTIGDLA